MWAVVLALLWVAVLLTVYVLILRRLVKESGFMSENQAALPKYKCHKEVWALKIAKIEPGSLRYDPASEYDGSAFITPNEPGYAPFKVDAEYIRKHKPQVGGYWVKYDDGYESWSPAEAFENGYSRIN